MEWLQILFIGWLGLMLLLGLRDNLRNIFFGHSEVKRHERPTDLPASIQEQSHTPAANRGSTTALAENQVIPSRATPTQASQLRRLDSPHITIGGVRYLNVDASLTFDYWTRNSGQSHRTVKVRGFNAERDWIRGYCHLRNSDRVFYLPKMKNVRASNRGKPIANIRSYLRNSTRKSSRPPRRPSSIPPSRETLPVHIERVLEGVHPEAQTHLLARFLQAAGEKPIRGATNVANARMKKKLARIHGSQRGS